MTFFEILRFQFRLTQTMWYAEIQDYKRKHLDPSRFPEYLRCDCDAHWKAPKGYRWGLLRLHLLWFCNMYFGTAWLFFQLLYMRLEYTVLKTMKLFGIDLSKPKPCRVISVYDWHEAKDYICLKHRNDLPGIVSLAEQLEQKFIERFDIEDARIIEFGEDSVNGFPDAELCLLVKFFVTTFRKGKEKNCMFLFRGSGKKLHF